MSYFSDLVSARMLELEMIRIKNAVRKAPRTAK